MTEFATDFDLVMSEYPRKDNKAYARKCWNKLNPDTETVQLMLDALVWQKETDQWKRGIIPHFSTWLNQARWEDDAPACHCKPQATGEVLELAKSIARANAEQATEGRTRLQQREAELMAQGMSAANAKWTAAREWWGA